MKTITAPKSDSSELIIWFRFHEALCDCICKSPAWLRDEACVIGKRTLEHDGAGASCVLPLTTLDKAVLEELLFKLPPLTGEMTQVAMDNFMTQLRLLEGRPDWEPVLRTVEQQQALVKKASAVHHEHLARMKKWAETGRLNFVNGSGEPTAWSTFARLTKDEALKYLNACKIRAVDQTRIFEILGLSSANGASLNQSASKQGATPVSNARDSDGTGLQELEAPKDTAFAPGVFPALKDVVEDYVRTDQAAHYLKRKPQTLRTWASAGQGPLRPEHSGRMLLWSIEDIRALMGRT